MKGVGRGRKEEGKGGGKEREERGNRRKEGMRPVVDKSNSDKWKKKMV